MSVNAMDDAGRESLSRRQVLGLAAGSAAMLIGREAMNAEINQDEAAAAASRRFDVLIVGGGPAGLSAALVLGRACRSVLLCDAGQGRNAPAAAVHGFLSRDGTPPAELRRIAREQLTPYAVEIRDVPVADARKVDGGFEVRLENGERIACRKLILATGLVDELPEIPGLREFWGSGVFQCPYCHGWELRGKLWAFMAPSEFVIESATLLLGWTKRLTLLTNGPAALADADADRAWLQAHAIEVIEEPIERLAGTDGTLESIRFQGGRSLACSGLQMRNRFRQRSSLPEKLGCEVVQTGPTAGMIQTDFGGATKVEGLSIIGDASVGAPSVAKATADGSIAAAVANRAMLIEDAAASTARPE